jgi:hypothetical protein
MLLKMNVFGTGSGRVPNSQLVNEHDHKFMQKGKQWFCGFMREIPQQASR